MEIIPKTEEQIGSQVNFFLKKFVKAFTESEKIILKNHEILSKINNLNNLPENLPNDLKLAIKKHKNDYIEILQRKKLNEKKLNNLLENREEHRTKDVLNEILNNTNREDLIRLTQIFFSNEELLNNSTILRGPTKGYVSGQATLEGNFDCVNPQVHVLKYNGSKWIGTSKDGMPMFKDLTFEEFNREQFNEVVFHELIHTFTQHIIITFKINMDSEVLHEEEIFFYNTALNLHKEFLIENKTNNPYLDSLSEFIAKTISAESNWNGGKYKELMTKTFEKMYKNNRRKIVSLSKHLHNNIT